MNSKLRIPLCWKVTGTNTYTGGTTIENGGVLLLGKGGNTGSIAGSIADDGTLVINRGNAVAITQAISGTGLVLQAGDGTTTINRAETYSGGTTVANGELSIDRASAIGAGQLTLSGGEFLATGNVTVANTMSMSGDFTIAAAHGKTANFDGVFGWGFDSTGGASLTFGEGANDGTIVWHTPGGSSVTGSNYGVVVAAGTLRAGDSSMGTLLAAGQAVVIDNGATLDTAGFSVAIKGLAGAGTLLGSGGSTIELIGADFAGPINGAFGVTAFGDVTLSGGGNFTNGITIEDGAILTLASTAHEDVFFFGGGNETLRLNNPGLFDGTVHNFGPNEDIDLPTIDFSGGVTIHYKSGTGVLTVSDGTHSAHVTIGTGYTLSDFGAIDDGSGGTDIIIVV